MKKSAIVLALGAAFGGMSAANAALLQAGSTGTITVERACFTFGTCAIGGTGDVTDNGILVNGIGSSIAGDGIRGIMNFTVGADGNSFSLTSFNMDAYTGTAGGNFVTRMVDVSGAGGTISDTGEMILDLTGRTGLAQFFTVFPGEQPWNLDTHGATQALCAPGTGKYTLFTTGNSTAIDCINGGTVVDITGSALVGSVAAGQYTGSGTLVSAGNVGDKWGAFDGTPYSEIFQVTVTGTANGGTVIPIPAAVWLLGSGLLGLVGVARRKKASAA